MKLAISYPMSLRLTAAAALGLTAAVAFAQDVQIVRIAHAGPTSGGIAHIGKDTENGVRQIGRASCRERV